MVALRPVAVPIASTLTHPAREQVLANASIGIATAALLSDKEGVGSLLVTLGAHVLYVPFRPGWSNRFQ